MSKKESISLKRSMTTRHIMMMALGGAIGAGLFKGSSVAVDMAGPAVLIAYLIGGMILLFIMQGLADMTIKNKQARTFHDLIEPAIGSYPAYFLDWIYWKMWVLNIAAEAIVSAMFLQYWFPQYPIWALALIISIAVTIVNLLSVKIFAETEYWLAFLKISVIIIFIMAGLFLMFVTTSNHQAVGLSNLTRHGGFFPNGIDGLVIAMLVVIYSYGGTELIGVTLGETKNPEKVIPKATRGTLTRIVAFYLLPFFIIVSLIPWNQVNNATESPFVTVFDLLGIPYAADIMNGVILLALVSSMNSGLYASSRVIYTQAIDGSIAKIFSKLSIKKVPTYAILLCTSSLYIGVLISIIAGENTFNYLMGSLGYTVLFIWLIIASAHFKSCMQQNSIEKRKFPITTLIAIISLLLILAGVIITTKIIITFITLIIYLAITAVYIIKRK
ncbi:AAT family amino acid transporter [Bacillus capparidis]|uniref:AAT family amino acid transporter n=1 Tax=Bacillus capparidis TaxID=1840411 RepID=A0ABS4CYA4_9BACI|nr:AAT family amino acid transporter [Bacillus capparidis]